MLLIQLHHRYIRSVAPRRHGNRSPPPWSACFHQEELMSFVTTPPEMVTSTPSMSPVSSMPDARLPGGSNAHRRDGAGVDGSRRVERRRHGGSGDSPVDILGRLPAVVVLE